MATSTITKILFRQGLDITRRTGGGFGITLNAGEPGFCLDTGRLYVGDGITVGGRNIGIANQGGFATLSSASPTYYNFTQSTYQALTSTGVDKGDLLYDSTYSILYYVTSKNAVSAVPAWSEIQRYNLIGNVAAWNGVSAVKILDGNWGSVTGGFSLHPTYFSVGGALVNVLQNFQVNGASTFNNTVAIAGTVDINAGNLNVNAGNITTTGSMSAGGIVYANGGAKPYSSDYWASAWTNVNSNSGGWQSASTTLQALTPLAWSSPIVADVTFTQTAVGVPSTAVKAGINIQNSAVVGLVVKGTDTTITALSVIGGIAATGDIIAFSTSDERLKTNVSTISNALDIIDSINGVEFDWNCSWRSGPDVGVIAQQVEKVFPRVVIDREDGYKAVNYEKIVPLLIQCIKGLKAKIKE